MKTCQRLLLLLALVFNVINHANAQSTCVFDANYFDSDNTAPPIKIGKGFHINDIYKQTRSCFTSESSNPNNLTAQQVGGQKTSIRLFYTKTNEQYNSLRTQGHSGKVSFLNLFSFGGKKLEEYSNKEIQNKERLVFKATVDFGIYSFDNEPTLTNDAKSFIEQKQLQDFVKMFGTHYISGIRKESSVHVVLIKESENNESESSENSSTNAGIKIPYKGSGSLEVESGNWINQELQNNKYSVSIEIYGPSLDKNDIQGKIEDILNGNIEDKSNAIAGIIDGALKNISEPSQGLITQFYYSPFSLYGLDGIYWDERKQADLTKINEAIIDVYSAKTEMDEIISGSGKQQLISELEQVKLDEEYVNRVTKQYDEIIPAMRKLRSSAERYLGELETMYKKCSDVYCENNTTCCDNDKYILELKKFNFEGQMGVELNKITLVIEDIVEEILTPECEKRQQGVITIYNLSTNPYYLYQDNKFLMEMPGNSTQTYYVDNGIYNFKAVQKSGYAFYATENFRTANITGVCHEVILKVGFED